MFQPKQDNPYRIFQSITNYKQKEYNAYLFRCMCDLKNVCNYNNIKHTFIKGLGLAADIYDQPEKRKSHDIDLLVNINDVDKLLSILKAKGFYSSQNEDIANNNPMIVVDNGHHHLDSLYKDYEVEGIIKAVEVELHISPFESSYEYFGHNRRDDQYTVDVIERSQHISIN